MLINFNSINFNLLKSFQVNLLIINLVNYLEIKTKFLFFTKVIFTNHYLNGIEIFILCFLYFNFNLKFNFNFNFKLNFNFNFKSNFNFDYQTMTIIDYYLFIHQFKIKIIIIFIN